VTSSLPKCVVIGGGGHAAVLIDSIRCAGVADPVAVLDPDAALRGKTVMGVAVAGSDDRIADMVNDGITLFCVGMGSIGADAAAVRKRLFDNAHAAGLIPLSVIHPTAFVSKALVLGDGATVLANATIAARATLGRNVIVNNGATAEHDCMIGDHAHIATGAVLAGNVTVGALSHVGANAVVRQFVSIGERAMIGAGAVVIEDVPDGTTVIGNPARPAPAGQA